MIVTAPHAPTPTVMRRAARLVVALALAAVVHGCGRDGGPATGEAAAFEQRVQATWSRFARVRRPSAGTLLVVLPDNARTARTRAALEREARFLGRGAFDSGAAQPGDTVVVEYQRVRRVGPLEFGARRTRFTFLEPPPVVPQPPVRL